MTKSLKVHSWNGGPHTGIADKPLPATCLSPSLLSLVNSYSLIKLHRFGDLHKGHLFSHNEEGLTC